MTCLTVEDRKVMWMNEAKITMDFATLNENHDVKVLLGEQWKYFRKH